MKSIYLLITFVCALNVATGSITINYAPPIGPFADNASTPQNNMQIVMVVDTLGNGFLAGSYVPFDYSTSGLFLSTASGATDDWLVYATDGFSSIPLTFSDAGPGYHDSMNALDYTNLSANQNFGYMWFEPGNVDSTSVGDHYGLFTDANLLIPSDGSTLTPDGSVYSPSSAQYTVVAVPEPSTIAFAFGLLAAAGVLWNRRRR